MNKIGRNYPCPCGSGLKFKKCCLTRATIAPASTPAVPSLTGEIDRIRYKAAEKDPAFLCLGVFILFATKTGDAWVLEATDMDAVQVAKAGEPVEIEIEATPESITINWSHRFRFADRKLITLSYLDKREESRDDFPIHQIHSTVKKIQKSVPAHLRRALHLDGAEPPGDGG